MSAESRRSLPDRLLGGGRNFTLLWAGEAVSNLGSSAALIAYPLLTLRLTGWAGAVGLVMAVAMVSQLVAGLPGGLLVDRFDRRGLMLLCDVLRLAAQAVLVAGLVIHHADLLLIIAVAAIDNAITVAFGSAETVVVRYVVDASRLPVAIARVQARDAGAALAGPPIGGVLFAIAPWLPFAFNAASYLVSFGCIGFIRMAMRAPADAEATPTGRPSRMREMLAGLRWLWGVRFLRVTMLLIAGTNVASNSLILIAIVAAREQGNSSAATGLLLTTASAGSLTGALAAPAIIKRLSIRAILILNRGVWVAVIPQLLLIHDIYAVGALIGVLFFLGPSGSTAVIARRMAITPEQLQGRASSATRFCAGIAAPAGTVAIAFILSHFGLAASILALTGWMALLAILTLMSRSLITGSKTPQHAEPQPARETQTKARPGVWTLSVDPGELRATCVRAGMSRSRATGGCSCGSARRTGD
jgi:Transmembrane secretion effector